MPREVVRSELVQRIRRRARMLSATGFAVDAEVHSLADEAMLYLYDLLIGAQGPTYYQTTVDLPTVAGQAYVDLPQDFYRLLAVLGNDCPVAQAATAREGWVKLRAAGAHDLDVLSNATGDDVGSLAYQLSGVIGGQSSTSVARLLLWPTPATSAQTLRVQYVPTCLGVEYAGGDAYGLERRYDGVHGWEEVAVLWAAIRLKSMEESDTSDLERALEREEARIARLAPKRDQVEPEYVGDVRGGSYLDGVPTRPRWP